MVAVPLSWADWTLWTEYFIFLPTLFDLPFVCSDLANSLLPALCDLHSDLLSGSWDMSQRIGVKAPCGAEFWGVIFTHLSQIGETAALSDGLQQQTPLYVYQSSVPGTRGPEERLKITLESAHPFQRAHFSSVFLGRFGEISHGVYCLLPSSKNAWELDWAGFNETVMVMVSVSVFIYDMLGIISPHFSPWLQLAFFSGFWQFKKWIS